MNELEVWRVYDATKLQGYMECPRRYLFERVLGWAWQQPNVHLVFGSAVHLAMEVFYNGPRPLYSQPGANKAALIMDAFLAFQAEYEKSFGVECEEMNAPKNSCNALRALTQYATQHPEDQFDILHVETAGTVPISSTRVLHFKTDLIAQDERGYFSLEHKTSGHFTTKWAAQWRQKMQGGVYTHVLYCLYPPEQVYGVLINGIFVTREPRMKRDGTPYANSTDNEFHRVPIRKNPKAMEAWLSDALHWCEEIDAQHEIMLAEGDGASVLTACPKNTQSCAGWGVCPFLDYCSVWNNPLQHVEEVPSGFEIRHWDPRAQHHREKVTL